MDAASHEARGRRLRLAVGAATGVATALWLAGCGGGSTCIAGVPCGPVPRFDENVPAPVATSQRFASMGLGDWHVCMLDGAGAAWCWGSNEYGQLGATSGELCMDGNVACSSTPLRVDGGRTFASVVAGRDHTCGLAADGQAWCWGLGRVGQLGDGLLSSSPLPVPVAGGRRFVALSASLFAGVTCGLEADGSLWCWGTGFTGPAGPAASAQPVRWTQPAALALRSVSLGEAHACGLDAGGTAWCWGRGGFGELGTGSGADSATPVAVAGGRTYRQIAVGPMHSCALAADGQAWCWGLGAVGDGGPVGEPRLSPAPVAGGVAFERIASGAGRSCGSTVGGTTWCWGSGGLGGLGDGASVDRAAPVMVAGSVGFPVIGVGNLATCGIAGDGAAWCWGWNETGALGRPIVAR